MSVSSQPEIDLVVTPVAGVEVKKFMDAEGVTVEQGGLRVSVQPGGCSGFKYSLVIEDQVAEDDVVLPNDGFKRSEEHTSELQSLAYLVCRLLLEKKKQIQRLKNRRSQTSCARTPMTRCAKILMRYSQPTCTKRDTSTNACTTSSAVFAHTVAAPT